MKKVLGALAVVAVLLSVAPAVQAEPEAASATAPSARAEQPQRYRYLPIGPQGRYIKVPYSFSVETERAADQAGQPPARCWAVEWSASP